MSEVKKTFHHSVFHAVAMVLLISLAALLMWFNNANNRRSMRLPHGYESGEV